MKVVQVAISLLLLNSGAAFSAQSEIPPNTDILICSTPQTAWAPFEYHEKTEGKLVGYNIDVIKEILKPYNLRRKDVIRPWKRCLNSVKSGEFHMIWPTSLNDERRRDYLFSRHSYELTPAYFYLKSKYPNSINSTQIRENVSLDLRCGILGYNYTNFGFKNDEVERSTKTHEALITRLQHKFCHVALARLEIIAAAGMIGKPLLTKEIAYGALPVAKERFHFLISKNHPQGKALLSIINDGLDRLERTGQLKSILNSYLPNLK